MPYVLQVPGVDGLPSSIVASGYVYLSGGNKVLPILFSFEEWVKRMEEQAELPSGSLTGNPDGDGQDSLTEYALGSDLQSRTDMGKVETAIVTRDGARHLQLTFNLRSDTFGLSAELQHSLDGEAWESAEDTFKLPERKPVAEGIEELRLIEKEPTKSLCSLFRTVVAP